LLLPLLIDKDNSKFTLFKGGKMKNGRFSRRDFLKLIGVVGGSRAVWSTMKSWGMMIPTSQVPPALEGNGNGVRVIVLGAGLGGMTAAYELMLRGYDVQVLEAQNRAGGRNWSVRQGTELTEHGCETQVCEYDEGLYANLGPWRIPYHHESVLYYCKLFNIPMEPFINYQEASYVFVEGDHGPLSGRPIRIRELHADMRGYTAELLAKCAQDGQLEADLDDEHVDMLLDYLIVEGLLDGDDMEYIGDSARGYITPPGALDQPGEESDPFEFTDILPYATEIYQQQGVYLGAVAGYNYQMTMFQPVGGMDQIGKAFAHLLGDRIDLQAEVREIRQGTGGVRIVVRNTETGDTREINGDYCICNIPLPVLINIPSDFSVDMLQAMRSINYATTGKIGIQFSRRFWEEDDRIYGGETRTNISEIGGIAYPNYGFFGQKGVLQAYYNFGMDAIRVSNLSLQGRTEVALHHGSKIHPQYREMFENAFSVAWHRFPYQLGGWAEYNDHTRERYYPRLIQPDGRIYLVGDHISYLSGWQAGAIESAWKQIERLHQRVRQAQAA
jgi:monoamine oxidase